MIMSVLANIHPGILEFYFVSIINYIFDYALTVPGEVFCNLIKKKKNNSKNKVLCCYSNDSKVTLVSFHLFPLLLWFWAFFNTSYSFASKKKRAEVGGAGGGGGEGNDSHSLTFFLTEYENAFVEMGH